MELSDNTRKIVHIDMDAFYASVEQRDHPELKGKPLAVGGTGRRGVVMTASYEARRFGVCSAMPSGRARRLCPNLLFVKPRFDAYKEASKIMRGIFHEYADLVEPLSLDEAFLDVTDPLKGPLSGTLIAREIKEAILEQTGLTSSAGVASNKFLAKVASGMNKPDGLTVITPGEAENFIAALPIERFFGVGPATAKRFTVLGIKNGEDLRERSRQELIQHFGKAGHWYYRIARGIDERPVSPNRERKSLSAERTFFDDIATVDDMDERLSEIAEEVARRMHRSKLAGRTISLKIKYHDFVIATRSRTVPSEIWSAKDITAVARMLLHEAPPDRPVRLLGVGVAKLRETGALGSQLALDLLRPQVQEK
jgi:DNA polymerase-4